MNKNKLIKSLLFSHVCLEESLVNVNNTHFKSLLGYRSSLFSLVNPFLYQVSLKMGLLLIELLKKNNFQFLFLVNIKNSLFFEKFAKICKENNMLLFSEEEFSPSFLTNKKSLNLIVISLFLTPEKFIIIQKETSILSIPLISFNDLSHNKFSTTLLYIGGNYKSLSIQNFILILLSICLSKDGST